MVRSSGVYQGAELVNETEEVFQGARESERMELSMMAKSSGEEGVTSGGKAEDMSWESESRLIDFMLR